MQPSHNNDDLNKKNNFPENENKFSQNHTPITTFEKLAIKEIIPIFSNNNVKKCLMAWKECFKADPRTFFILTYNMMTMNYRDYWVLLKKHLNIEDENTKKNVIIFQDLNLLMTCKDVDLLKQSKTFTKLMQFQQFPNQAELMRVINKMQS